MKGDGEASIIPVYPDERMNGERSVEPFYHQGYRLPLPTDARFPGMVWAMRTPLWTAALLAALALAPAGCVTYVSDSDKREGWSYREGSALELDLRASSPVPDPSSGALIVGTWEGDGSFARPPSYSQRHYALEIRSDGPAGAIRRKEIRSLDEVDGLPGAGREFDERRVEMRLRRDAGLLILEGEKEGSHAAGRALLRPDSDFEALGVALAGRPLEPIELAELAFADVQREDLEALRAATHHCEPADLVRMRDRGLPGGYLASLAACAREFTIDDALRLRDAGVSADYIREFADAGYSPSVDELVRLRHNGVGPDFARTLTQEGSPPPEIDELIRLRNSGVSAQFVADLRAAGYRFSTDQVIRLSHSSISAAYARGIREAGYDLDADDLIHLRTSGVSVQYVKDLQEPGYEPLSIKQIIDARNKGLTPEFVKSLRRKS